MRCPTCGGEIRLALSPAGRSRSGPVGAVSDPRMTPTCSLGCVDATADLRAALDRALDAGLTFARSRGRFDRCGVCAQLLDLPARASTRAVTVEPELSGLFTLTFTLVLVRCGDCGMENVPSGLHRDVRASAFEACRTSPQDGRTSLLRRLRDRGGRGYLGRP